MEQANTTKQGNPGADTSALDEQIKFNLVRDLRMVRDLRQWLRTGSIERRVDYVIERGILDDVGHLDDNERLLEEMETNINSREWTLIDVAAKAVGIAADEMNDWAAGELLPAVFEDQIESDDERMDRTVVWFTAEMDRLDIEHSLLNVGSPEDRQRYCDKWNLVAKDTKDPIVQQAIARSFEERRWFKMEFAAEANNMTAEDFNLGFGNEILDPNRFHVRRLASEMGPGVAVRAVYAKTQERLGCSFCSWAEGQWLFVAPCCNFPGGRIEVDREDGHCLMIARKKATAQDDDDRLDPDATFVLESNKYVGLFWGPNTLDNLRGASRYSGKELETDHMVAFWMGRYTPRRISPKLADPDNPVTLDSLVGEWDLRVKDLNADVPSKMECFVEAIHDLKQLAKGEGSVPPWLTREECLKDAKDQVLSFIVGDDKESE